MKLSDHQLLTEIMLAVFRANGALIERGNRLVKPLGLTSARWQVLGAIAYSEQALTVPQIAKEMGLTRQSVQRLVNEMVDSGYLELVENKYHKNSKRVQFTQKGNAQYEKAMSLHLPWVKGLVRRLSRKDMERAHLIINELNHLLLEEKL